MARLFLIRLEQQLQRVTGDPDAGLPYWDWAADGTLPPAEQSRPGSGRTSWVARAAT